MQCLKDVIIALHMQKDMPLPRVKEGYKQDCIATKNMIGKIFFFFNNIFFNSYLNITTTAMPSDTNMNNNFFSSHGYII